MSEPNDKCVQAIVVVNDFQEKLKAIGVNYNTAVSVWEGEGDQKIFTMHSSSDPIAKQRTLQVAILPDGRGRLIETKEAIYPHDADLHPDNARVITHSGSVSYVNDDAYTGRDNFFSEIIDIFKVDNT